MRTQFESGRGLEITFMAKFIIPENGLFQCPKEILISLIQRDYEEVTYILTDENNDEHWYVYDEKFPADDTILSIQEVMHVGEKWFITKITVNVGVRDKKDLQEENDYQKFGNFTEVIGKNGMDTLKELMDVAVKNGFTVSPLIRDFDREAVGFIMMKKENGLYSKKYRCFLEKE